MNEFLPFDFYSAGQRVLRFLHQRFGFGLWMITRTDGKDWIVLQAEDHGYGVSAGKVFQWNDSFCCEMVKGNGPRIAPDSAVVPAYATAPIGRNIPINAYVGIPLTLSDGSLFGTLCAIDPCVQSSSIKQEQELIELLAALLSSILQAELRATEEVRRNERLEVEAHTDALTQLSNRRAWDQLLIKEEERCKRYGHSAAVIVVDLDDLKDINDTFGHSAGDQLLQHVGEVLCGVSRDADVVARLGGDEFGIIAAECDNDGAAALVLRIRNALSEKGISASIGHAIRLSLGSLQAAWDRADRLMYEDKHSGKK
jgi:diguanylate cyclase